MSAAISSPPAAHDPLSGTSVDDLTIPAAGSTTTKLVLSRYLRRTLTKLGELPARRFTPPRAAELDVLRRAVSQLLGREPGAAMSLLRRPTFGVLVHTIHDALAKEQGPASPLVDGWAAELVEQGLFELALLGKLEEPVALGRPLERLSSMAAGLLLRFAAPTEVRFGARALELREAPTASWRALSLEALVSGEGAAPQDVVVERPFPRLRAGFTLSLSDNNPLSLVEAHPEKKGNAVDLGGHEASEWVAVLDEAFALVERYLPEIAAEMRLVLHQIVPVGYDAERHFSASYKESVGTVYMSLHPNLMTMTEALIHEFQHNKVGMLFHLDPVMHNAFFPLFKSPVRPDPRPLHGVLLAVHAFQPVAMLYHEMFNAGDERVAGRPDVIRRYAQVRKLNRDACKELLPNAKATPIGAPLLAEIAKWNDWFAALERDEQRVEGMSLTAGALGPERDPAEH